MCADAKTLRVDRGERLGSLGAAAVSVRASLRECCSTQRAKSRRGQKKKKGEGLTKGEENTDERAALLLGYC